MSPRGFRAINDVISPILLVGSDEVGIVYAGQGLHFGHFLANELLETWLENLSPIHGIGKIHGTDVPAANDQVVGVNHG